MAKYCSICGKKLGLLEGNIQISDGNVCLSCWASAGFDMGVKSLMGTLNMTKSQIADKIGISALQRQAQQQGFVPPPSQTAAPAQGAKPVDITISMDSNYRVSFSCVGQPTINFDDLVKGNEMIIGDGFVFNLSSIPYPETRISCEFDPPIVDPGIIYYEEGSFPSGVQGKFEIDDPPVNIEEYAKIKQDIYGKIKFTLFFGENQMGVQECPMIVKAAPEAEMDMLMKSIAYQEEKNASGPVNVFLYARPSGSYEIDLMRNPELLYSIYSNGMELLIDDVIICNETSKTLKKVQFEAKFTSNILSPVSVLLGDVAAGESIAFEVDDPAIDVDKLETLTEIEPCIATYTLKVNGKVVAESTGKVTICPYNQWNASLVLLPAYMTPNHPNVIGVLQNASQWMLVNGMNPSLEGYQSDKERVEEMIGAVYNAVKEANIIYSNPPASFFGPQRIRLCGEVFDQKFATCMDMTILFASCLESFGLHPVLITAPGHIFAGVWTTARGRLEEPVISDAKLILQYINNGDLIPVECTAMNAGNEATYEDAKNLAYSLINEMAENEEQNHECIDVQIVRAIGVRPLPMRVHNSVPPQQVLTPAPAPAPAAEAPAPPVKEAAPEPAPTAKAEPGTYTKEDYKSFAEDLTHINIDNFYDKQSKRVIKNAIAEIVATEGPISQPALIRTLINTTSLGRVGKQITEHLDKLVSGANIKITRQNGVRFLWPYGYDPANYMVYRYKEQRSPEEICKYEMKNAVCYLIQENGPMTKADITKALTGLFGYSRSSKKIEDGAKAALKAAKELGAIEENEIGKIQLI